MKQPKVFFFIILFSFINLLAETNTVNESRLKQDEENMLNLMEVLNSGSLEIDFYKKNIENLNIHSEKELGFGVKNIEAYQSGAYTSNVISIYTYNNKIFYFRVRIIGKDIEKIDILKKRNSSIAQFISDKWIVDDYQRFPTLSPIITKRLKYHFLDQETYSIYKTRIANKLGKLLDMPVDHSLRDEYEILISPFEQYNFGTACGYAGIPPLGRQAIKVIKKRNPQLLRNIIRGYSLEGRIYGIQALLELASKNMIQLTKEDISTMKKVINLDVIVNQCGGCMSSSLKAKELFKKEPLLQ